MRRDVERINRDGFTKIECFGNSYDPTSCKYIADLIRERSSEELWYADFSNMFVTRGKETLPPSIRTLVVSLVDKPIQELHMHDNAFGPIGVDQFKEFLRTATHLTVLSVSNTGLGPEAAATIANSLQANEQTKLKKLRISRSRVEDNGALALAQYFSTYDTLEYLEIKQNSIRGNASA